MGDEQQRAVEGVPTRSRAARSRAGRGGWSARRARASSRPRPSAARARRACAGRGRGCARRGRPRPARARTWPAASAPPAGSGRSARRRRRSACPSPSKPARAWSSVPIRTPGPTQRSPADSGSRPSRPSTSVVFPLPFGPTSATRSPHASSRSSGPRTKLPRRSSARSQPGGDVAGALAAAEAQLQLPALPRLVDDVEPLERLLGRAHLARLLLRALGAPGDEALVGVGALGLLHARLRPLALAVHAVGQAVALGRVGLVSAARAWRAAVARSSR